MVDTGEGYDLDGLEPILQAQRDCKILPIWDLCHYGYPDRLDPFEDEDGFVRRSPPTAAPSRSG